MIDHKFYISPGGYPMFKLEARYDMLHDLANSNIEEVRKIISGLTSVMNGELKTIDLEGYDTTTVECPKNECLIYYGVGYTTMGPIPVKWLLDLFRDWLAFLIAFEGPKDMHDPSLSDT